MGRVSACFPIIIIGGLKVGEITGIVVGIITALGVSFGILKCCCCEVRGNMLHISIVTRI